VTVASIKYDVVIVGAGPAGITAAIALAKADIPVLVIEGGVFPGAENWSGAVYFTENLAQPDVLGPQAVAKSAYERPVTKRGACIYNGHSMVGLNYRNPSTFANCYTVLRPTYDHYLAELAESFGATILTETTVDSLLRDECGRIIGVHTDRGSIYADVVFLAEGDASHLVAKEGYERCKDPGAPHFLQGIAEVIELAPDEIERRFNLPRGEGAAFEIILRNGSIHNRQVNLNMGGFIYTNAASVSLGLVLPLDNLAREFSGDHNRLMEWFKSLPEVRRLVGNGRSVAYGAKIIRGGGFRELPQLVDDGLALGGACTGIGLDFPYPNFTGPATAMGRLFANAVKEIRATGGECTRLRLEEVYERLLRQTHYFRNIEFLEKWPHYVEHTRVFFGRFVDAKTGSLDIASHPSLNTGQKLWQLAKFLRETMPPKYWGEVFRDFREQRDALGLNRTHRDASGRSPMSVEGTGNFECFVDGESRTDFMWPLSRIVARLPRILTLACDHVYRNDDTPLPVKLNNAISAARRGIGLLDVLAAAGFWLVLLVLMPVQWLCEMIKLVVTRPSPEKYLSSFFQRYRTLIRQRTNLDEVKQTQPIEEKLALISYSSETKTHIKVLRPEHFQDRSKIAESPLWHVCPAKVYEDKVDDLGEVQIIVNFENCIKCESCLRGAPTDVVWTRQRKQRLIFNSPTAANRKLLDLIKRNGHEPHTPSTVGRSPTQLAPSVIAKLRQFCETVYADPRYIDAARARWLISLAEEAPARIRNYARRHKFFWAEAEARTVLETLPSPRVIPSEAKDLSVRVQLDKLFPKQSIKDLEHGKRLTDEQLSSLKILAPTSDTLRELARKDPSLAVLVSGIYSAQIASRPELADSAWIGLTAARTHWKDFAAMEPVTPPRVAEAVRAIALGAGEMLLERVKAHVSSRVQFPGLFKDEDGRDGIAKFGAVKALLSAMEAQRYLLEALEGFAESDAAKVKALASEALLTLTYNAGQSFGGTAYSEDDVLSKFYRDSACFPPLLFEKERGDFREFALDAVKKRAGDNPSELEAEIVKMFANAASPPRLDTTDLGSQILDRGYIEQRLQRPPSFNYREALKSEQHYDHGDFLVKPFNLNEWRYVPEMLFADGELRAYHEELYTFFTETFWNKRFEGQPYHRLVEKLHMVPLDDVREMVARGFMRMYIPKEFGGEALLKAHYYILCPLSMRYADPSYALTIMAHSSIGTTPILLGLNQDLPRAKADLQEFLANPSAIANLKSEISRILRMLDSPEALKVKKVFTALGEKVKNEIGKKPMLRAIAAEFLAHFMDAGRAGLRMDLSRFKSELLKSQHALDGLRSRAEAVVAELDRRAEAAKLFLRLISAGQISAFALTEPSAGSDSGGIQTRAVLKRVEVLTDSDGVKYFMRGNERRTIIDAATIDATKIDYSSYDYATSTGLRRYEDRPFHDIAQIRREGEKEFYDYYELNGAKMWITNGHVAGVMCLYARTPEGPTGLMVDRYAEGLVVGKDEEKMGQRGSPTNELGLTSVRVPRENIIGIEGRGQVNALETLNVGRTGLCVSVTAMIAKIVEQTREFARERGLDEEPGVQQLVGGMAMELYAVESLAYELIGRFDHHGTKDARTESAIGKYYASEALHRVIAAAERIYGIEGVTQLHELEKHRRDARVLNIYEGTNEVQRFLILRDLVDHVLPKATGNDELVRDLKSAVDTFGSQVWQNTGFQPTMFKLAEMAGYIKLMDSARWRTEWLQKNTTHADAQHRQLAETMFDRYVEFARGEIQRLHEEFEREFELLKQGSYPPQVRVAFLALQAEETHKKHRDSPRLSLSKPMHIVVVANVVPVLSPRPRVDDGELLETCFEFDAASRTALERALEVPQARVSVLAVAPRYSVELLRRALALGAHDATLIETDDLSDDVHATARLLADQISSKHPDCDLVLCGDALLGTVLAGDLGFASVAGVEEFDTSHQKAVLRFVAGETSREFCVDDYFAAFQKPLTVVSARELEALPQFPTRYALPPQPVMETSVEATPESAAKLLRTIAGVAGGGVDEGHAAFRGVVELVGRAKLPVRNSAVFVATPSQLDGIATARECAQALLLPFHVVVLGDVGEQAIRQLAARVEADSIYFVTNLNLADAPPDGIVAALQSLWKDTMPAVVASGNWANEILARFAMTFPRVQARYNVAQVSGRNGMVELAWPILGGKLHRVAAVASLTEHPLVMTVAKAEVAGRKAEGPKRVYHVPLEFEYSSEETEGHEPNGAKSIADAEFIIDVGYALRNRENFDYIIGPLRKRLEEIGVKSVTIGGTRKVVEELKLLSPEQQIGQTGTSVNPQVIISIGVSGAPQHIDYIGERATIIAFNKDPEAPLMTLNQRRARPKVVPIVGDLFETVPRFTEALKS